MVRCQTFKLQKLDINQPYWGSPSTSSCLPPCLSPSLFIVKIFVPTYCCSHANMQTQLSFIKHWRFYNKLTISIIGDDICQNMHFMVVVLVNPVLQWRMMPMRRFQHLNKIFLWTCQLFLNNVCYVVWLFWLEEDRGRRRDEYSTDWYHTLHFH